MDWQSVQAARRAQKCAALRFQKSGRHPFRDRITVYYDGKLLFERFCYGESAGLVFTLWAHSVSQDGQPDWDYAACPNSHKTEAPQQCTAYKAGALYFDGKPDAWLQTDALKHDGANGYPVWKVLFAAHKK